MSGATAKDRRPPTGIAAVNAAKQCCDPGGHPFTPDGTYLHVDRHGYPRRMCKQCAKDRRERDHPRRIGRPADAEPSRTLNGEILCKS